MAREDLVGKVSEMAVQSAQWSGEDPALRVDGGTVVEMIRQAAEEIELMADTGWHALTNPGDWAEYQLPHGYDRTRVVLLVRDPYWLHCYWEVGSNERASLRAQTGRELGDLNNVLRVHDLSQSPQGFYDVPINAEARNWYLETGQPGHTFQVELGVDLPGRGFLSISRSNVVTTPIDRVSDIIDEEWMVVEEDFRRLYRLAAGFGPGHSSLELMESLSKRLVRQMGSGAVSSLGSGFRLPGPERQFWLVVGTELIVYGATCPDAYVTIDQAPVTLRPDGTFSARYALPDGERRVVVTGASHDGQDQVTITPIVRKETH